MAYVRRRVSTPAAAFTPSPQAQGGGGCIDIMLLRTPAPKLALNAFIKKYKTGNCIGFWFYDYKPGRRRERATGKQLPTPNQIVAAFARQAVKGDYMVAVVAEPVQDHGRFAHRWLKARLDGDAINIG